jgi:hypothetical protein
MKKLSICIAMIASCSSTALMACDMDGFGGFHRFSAFSGLAPQQPTPDSAQTVPDQRSWNDDSRNPSPDSQQPDTQTSTPQDYNAPAEPTTSAQRAIGIEPEKPVTAQNRRSLAVSAKL